MPARPPVAASASLLLTLALALVQPAQAQSLPPTAPAATPVSYVVTFPEAEHHWAQVEVTFRDLGTAPLRARMSRSSPGRYAVHEFAKNIFQFEAFDGAGAPVRVERPDVDEWHVPRHDGTVRVAYRIFGDFADGTYLAVDTTHAHLNMPATFLWALGLEDRPITIRFEPPPGSGWTAGTQLYATPAPLTFSAPNLQYFMDSPVELAPLVVSTFTVADGPRGPARFRIMAHGGGTQADVDALAVRVERLVREARAVFGTFPDYEPGHYTILLDLVAWAGDDAMEHRNSTYISAAGASLASDGGRQQVLELIAHEVFHGWNVERLRPVGLEPFDFTRENITCCLWLAEGFTNYYATLLLRRAGLTAETPLEGVVQVINGSGRLVRSAVQMSEHAPFADAGVSNDVHDRSRTFISYYTYGAALGLALDLSLREQTAGRVTLDDYMRALWTRFGAPGGPAPGLVTRPYTLRDLRDVLADVSGDGAFSDAFFDRYVEGREAPDFMRLLAQAGLALRRTAAEAGWAGALALQPDSGGLRVGGASWQGASGLVPFGAPAYDAGLDSGDLIVTLDGQPATQASWAALSRRRPGERISVVLQRRDGQRVATTLVLAANPGLEIRESDVMTAGQRTFRAAWLRSRSQ